MKKLIFVCFAMKLLPDCKKRTGVGRVGGNTNCTSCCGLPDATQTGANIFACNINGSNWIGRSLSLEHQILTYGLTQQLVFNGGDFGVDSHYYMINFYIFNGVLL